MTLRQNLLIAAAFVAVVAILWLPFGFNVGFQGDGWSFFDALNTARLIGAAPPAPASRPTLNLIWQVAYALAPDSYVGVNLMSIAAMVGKGIVSAVILYHFTQRYALAFAFGSLVVLLPADSGLFYLGVFTLHFVVLEWLIATYCILLFYEKPRVSTALLIMLMLLVSTLASEIIFLFVLVGLLILFAKARRLNRRFVVTSALYIFIPGVNAVRYAILWLTKSEGMNYQSSLLDPTVTIGDMLNSIVRTIGNHFIVGWFGEGIGAYAPYAIAAGLIIGAVVWWLQKQDAKFTVSSTMKLPTGWLLAGGLLMIVLGVALYLPTIDRNSTIRTYYFSSLGAALILAVVGWQIAGRVRREVVFAMFAGVLAVIGCWRLLEDHAFYRDRAASQQQILRQIIDVVPRPQDNVGMVVIDEGSAPTLIKRFASSFFLRGSLSLIYDTVSLGAGLCDFTLAEDDPDACHFEPGQVDVMLDGGVYMAAAYDRLIVLRYTDSGVELVESLESYIDTPVPYDPAALIVEGEPPPRAATMLEDSDKVQGTREKL